MSELDTENETRSEVFVLRLTPSEKQRLLLQADDETGGNVAELIRRNLGFRRPVRRVRGASLVS